MCDDSGYSIVGPEHCVIVPRLTQEQFNLFSKNGHSHQTALGFRTPQTTWEFTIAYFAHSYYIKSIGTKNIHGMVHNSELISEPLAQIVIWHWKDNKQEIIKNQIYGRNEANRVISLKQQDAVSKVYFIIRHVEKRKPAKDLCRPLDFLPSSDSFTIFVGDQTFIVSAHRLMQISPVFRAMLTDEMSEKTSRKVEIEDADPEHFRAFLEVIDPDGNVQPNPDDVVDVLKLADRYQVCLAKDRCEMHLMNCVEKPLIERLHLAYTYGLDKLKASILSIGCGKLSVLYKTNLDKFEEGQFSNAMLQDLTSHMCFNE